MGIAFDDIIRDDASPSVPYTLEVTANATGGAWVALTPPTVPGTNLRSYVLMVEGASAAYEVTWKVSPGTGDGGLRVPANTPVQFPRAVAQPFAEGQCGWPSFRAVGASPVTVRMVMFVPVA